MPSPRAAKPDEARVTTNVPVAPEVVMISKTDIIYVVNKHRRVVEAIFERRANILWSDIEAMLSHFGAEISEGRGSRVRIALKDVRAVFHRPHPQKETDRGAVASMKRFLMEAGFRAGTED